MRVVMKGGGGHNAERYDPFGEWKKVFEVYHIKHISQAFHLQIFHHGSNFSSLFLHDF